MKTTFPITLATILAMWPRLATAYTITSFDPRVVWSGHNPPEIDDFDGLVGITGFTIEDFEDTALMPGLTVGIDGGAPAFSVPAGQGYFDNRPSNVWDGSQALNAPFISGDTVFQHSPGATSWGVGISDVEDPLSQIRILVNGATDLGLVSDLPNYVAGVNEQREVYVRIDAEAGDTPITQVRFQSLTLDGDRVNFDRLGVAVVPEPSTALLIIVGLIGLTFRGPRASTSRRHREQQTEPDKPII